MSQISLLPFLFPVYIFPNQLHQTFFGLNEAQLEALYQEQVLKLDLANPHVILIFLQKPICYLLMRLLQVFHQHGHNNIDKHKLSHKYKANKEEGSYVRIDATVLKTLLGGITLLSKCVLHNPIPVVSCICR